MFTEMGIKIKALIARKLPGDDSVTWVEPKRRGAAGEDEGGWEGPSSASAQPAEGALEGRAAPMLFGFTFYQIAA